VPHGGHNKNKENRGSPAVGTLFSMCARTPTATFLLTETAAIFNKISNNHRDRRTAAVLILEKKKKT